MASGAPNAFRRRERPALDSWPTPSTNSAATSRASAPSFKIVNQLLAGVHIAAACEGHHLYQAKLGLDISRVFEVITQSAGNSWMFENRIPHVLAGDYSPQAPFPIFTKDLGIVTEIGRKAGSSAALQQVLPSSSSSWPKPPAWGADDDQFRRAPSPGIAGVDLPGTGRDPGTDTGQDT